MQAQRKVYNIVGANDLLQCIKNQSKNIGGAKCYFFPYFKYYLGCYSNLSTPTSTGPAHGYKIASIADLLGAY